MRLYHGDAREILPLSPPADLVVTDPPYGIDYVTSRRSHSDDLRTPVEGDESLVVLREVVPLMDASLRDDRHWYVFASPRRIPGAQDAVGRLGGGMKQVLAWDKGDSGTVGDLEAGFGEAWEAILYGMKGRRPLRGKRPRTVIRRDWASTMDPVHPTVKPVGLLVKLLRWSSDEGETVLDPFAGSGTTLRAAKEVGRKAVGIEIEERYCEIAAERLSQETLDLGGAA